MTNLDAALEYAGLGWRVFPLTPRDKVPATAHGFKDATTDLAVIKTWWKKHPKANIGVATGRRSGLLVVDLDVKPEKGIDGPTTMRRWEREHGELPVTPTSLTGGGGTQHFFRYPEDGRAITSGTRLRRKTQFL